MGNLVASIRPNFPTNFPNIQQLDSEHSKSGSFREKIVSKSVDKHLCKGGHKFCDHVLILINMMIPNNCLSVEQ